jgi:hypothetical protein
MRSTTSLINKKIYLKDNLFTISRKQEKQLDLFWYGFITYTVSYILSTMSNMFLSAAAFQGIQLVGLGIMISGAVSLMKFKFDDKYLQVIVTLHLLYSLTVIGRGFQSDPNSVKKLIFDISAGMLPYFVPLVVLLPRNLGFYKKLSRVVVIFGIIFAIGVVLFYKTLTSWDWTNLSSQGTVEVFFALLAIPSGFLLVTYPYHKKKIIKFAAAVMAVIIYFLIYRARRGALFICLITLASAGMMFLINTKNKIMIVILSVFLVAFLTIFLGNIKLPAMFNFIAARGDEDTRSGVEQDMYADMSKRDWIIGKGINGTYYCPSVVNVNDLTGTGNREVIETGYLQVILNGGIVGLSLLLLAFLPAVYKGFFQSNNMLAKGAAALALVWVLSLYPTVAVEFNMRYIIAWIAVGICYSKKIRNMSDTTIKDYLAA